jgi:transcriptional regulator with GAF, ATPase, and Fis domain
VLQERKFQRVGSRKVLSADVRFIAATNRNLHTAIERHLPRGSLPPPQVFAIQLPPLRERPEYILPLSEDSSPISPSA